MSDVFLSYSRRDSEAVRRLHAALTEAGREAWVDWQGIPPTAEWMAEVRAAVDAADAFVVIVSPEWASSSVCRMEAEHAVARGKRIVPVVVRDTDPATVPERVGALNWIFLREGDDFAAGVATLLAALDLDLDWVRAHTRLLTRAGEWEARGRERSLLLRGRDLQAAETLLATAGAHQDPQPTPLQTAYLYAGRQAERRSARIRTIALAGGLAVAVVLSGLAVWQALVARDQATLAQARELTAASRAQQDADPELGLLLAIEAAERAPNQATDEQLRRALEASRLRARFDGIAGPITDLGISADGTRLLTNDGTVRVWDTVTRTPVLAIPGRVTAAAMSRDGSTIAVASAADHGSVEILDARSGAIRRVVAAHEGEVGSLDLSRDGVRLVTAGADGFARTWDLASGRMMAQTPRAVDDYVTPRVVRFSPDASMVASSQGNTLRLWTTADAKLVSAFIGHTNLVQDLAWSPDGSALATADIDGARVWDVGTASTVAVLGRFEEQIDSVAFDPTGGRVMTGGLDGTVRIWDAIDGAQVLSLDGGTGAVTRVVFSPDGRRAYTAAGASALREWSADPLDTVARLGAPTAGANDLDVSPDGTRIAVAANDLTGHVYDSRTGKEVFSLLGHASGLASVRFSKDGSKILTSSPDGTARLWDATNGASLVTLGGAGSEVSAAALGADGKTIATESLDGSIRFWTVGGNAEASGPAGQAQPTSMLFAPDGARLWVGRADGSLAELDGTTAAVVRSFAGHADAVFDIELSPDGLTLLTASRDGRAKLWDRASGQLLRDIDGGAAGLYGARFSTDGRFIVTAGADPFARVWDVRSGILAAMLPVTGRLGAPAEFMPGSTDLVIVPHSSPAQVVRCELCTDAVAVLALARQRVTRGLSSSEREAFLHERTTASVTPTPSSGEATPGPTETGQPVPTAPQAADEICTFGTGPCQLTAGSWRASRLEPPVRLHLAAPFTAFGESSFAAFLTDDSGNQFVLASGSQTTGAGKDEAIALRQTSSAVLEYLSSVTWLDVSRPKAVTIGGLPGQFVRLDSARVLASPLFYIQGTTWRWDPGIPNWVAAVDVSGTDLIVIAESTDPGFEPRFLAFLATIELTGPGQPHR